MSLPEVTIEHRERAQRMLFGTISVDDLAQLLANQRGKSLRWKKRSSSRRDAGLRRFRRNGLSDEQMDDLVE